MDRPGHHRRQIALCWVAALVALGLGLWFRLSGLGSKPLWLDEAYSAFAADHDLSFIWTIVPRYDVHPPLYYSMLHFWDLAFGDALLARRLLGLLFGTATIAAAAACAATLAGLAGADRLGRALITAMVTALVALQPLMIIMTQQVRPYPVMIFVYTIGVLAVLRLLAVAGTADRRWRGWVGVAFAAEALLLWLHALGPFYAASLSIALAVALFRLKPGRSEWTGLIIGQLLVGLVYLPAALISTDQAPTWAHSSWLSFDPAKLGDALSTIYLLPGTAVAVAGVFAMAVGGIVLARRGAMSVGVALLVLGLLPTTLSLVASLTLAPVFLARTLSPAAVPMLLLMGASLAIAPQWRRIMMALLLVVLLPFAWADYRTIRLPPPEDWRGTVAWLSAHIKPGDIVWAYPNEGALPLRYASRDLHRDLPVRQIPADIPALAFPGSHPAGGRGAVSLSAAQIDALMRSDAARNPPTIWLLGVASEIYDPADLMGRALGRTRVPIARFRRDEIEVVGLARRDRWLPGR
jgi:mannosyltransferase